MTKGFWEQLRKPFFVLAPLADVTDVAFRRVIVKYGKPDVFWTEFVSADGLMSPGRKILLRDLEYTEAERPIVAQLFTGNPEKMEKAAMLVEELGFDGLDINMGCPDRSVEKQGAGAALCKDYSRAQELIAAAKRGAPNLPISVKVRLGYNKNEIETLLPALLEAELAAVTIHARTRKEMSKVPARWEQIKRAVEIRDELGSESHIIGNGDVEDLKDAQERARETGCDGVMLGRAIFGNPWLFNRGVTTISTEEKLSVLVEHTKLFEELLGDVKSFAIMKKHFKAYVEGFVGAKELRMKLMEVQDANEVESTITNWGRN
jgi:nifR3 family TIM-barrel protein